MTETSEDCANRSLTRGSGRFILVVGQSGAGKDTLISLAKSALRDDPEIVFARRVITRAASASEDNLEVSQEQFADQLSKGRYATHWVAHGHRYALPRAIQHDIIAGRTVVANVSRTVIAALRQEYAAVVVIAIAAPPEVLAERLTSRARPSDGPFEHRLSRKVDEAHVAPDCTIVNVGSVEYHARQLVQLIKGEKGHVKRV